MLTLINFTQIVAAFYALVHITYCQSVMQSIFNLFEGLLSTYVCLSITGLDQVFKQIVAYMRECINVAQIFLSSAFFCCYGKVIENYCSHCFSKTFEYFASIFKNFTENLSIDIMYLCKALQTQCDKTPNELFNQPPFCILQIHLLSIYQYSGFKAQVIVTGCITQTETSANPQT